MTRWLSVLLIGGGALMVALAVAVEVLGIGQEPGFGTNQLRLTVAGVAAAAAGLYVRSALPHGGLRAKLLRDWAAPAHAQAGGCLLLAVWIGLLAAFVELAHQGVRKHAFGVMLKQPEHDVLWMLPLSYLILFGALGVVLAAAALACRRSLPIPVAVFAPVFLAVFSQLAIYPMHRLAVVALALGVAAMVARATAEDGRGCLAAARRSTGWMLGAVALVGISIPLGTWVLEKYSLARLTPAAAGAPNVLVIVLDTVRADHVGLCGYERDTTPRLDALARDAAVFDTVYSTSPWTLPAHVTLFTGRYHHESPADWLVPMDGADPTLAEVFAGRGYATGGFVGNLRYCSSEWGIARGFVHYEDFYAEPAVVGYSSILGRMLMNEYVGRSFHDLVRNDAATLTDRFLRWVDDVDEQPFFAFINYFDAHAFYLPPPPYDTQFGPVSPLIREWHSGRTFDAEEMQGFVDAYDGAIAWIDSQLGRLLDELDRRGLREDTLIVVTSDHGEQFGEHGITDHGNSLYVPLLHVPAVLSFPGRVPATRITEPVSLRDLPASILDLAGVRPPAPFPGHSLRPLLRGGPAAQEAPRSVLLAAISKGINTVPRLPHSRGDMQCLFADGMHFIRNGDGSEELYDLNADPAEERDLIGTAAGAETARRMRETIRLLVGK